MDATPVPLTANEREAFAGWLERDVENYYPSAHDLPGDVGWRAAQLIAWDCMLAQATGGDDVVVPRRYQQALIEGLLSCLWDADFRTGEGQALAGVLAQMPRTVALAEVAA